MSYAKNSAEQPAEAVLAQPEKRRLLKALGACSLAGVLPALTQQVFAKSVEYAAAQALMPSEESPHAATWLAYGATAGAWGTTGNYGASRAVARQDLIRIAANVSRFEPVNMLVANEQDRAEAEHYLAQIKRELAQNPHNRYTANGVFSTGKLPAVEAGGKIEFILCPINDLWARDTAPIFVKQGGKVAGVNLNFNGWGQEPTGAAGWQKDRRKAENGIQDQPIAADRKVADFILRHTQTPKISTWLVMEGGGIEVNGEGTAICTESCILNPNRNPGRSKAEVEAELLRLFGVRKVIWLKGLKAHDITDGHIDFYARFVNENTVLYALDNDPESSDYAVTRENARVLAQATTANGTPLKLIALNAPDMDKVYQAVSARQWAGQRSRFNEDSFAAGYIGYYATDKAIVMAQFGDEDADRAAYRTLQQCYPKHHILQIATDGLANGGGTIHCATQQQIVA